MIDHLIYDFDGTISDSYPVFLRIMRTLAKEKNFVIDRTDEQLLDQLLINVQACFVDLGINYRENICDFWRIQRELYKEFKPFPEVEPLLEKAIRLGKKNYIYTHSGEIVFDILKNMGIDGYFTAAVTSADGFPAKPAPNALQHLCRTQGLLPENCMMIGDRNIDTQAGQNAGMIGCLWDAYGRYPDEPVAYKIKTLGELIDLLDTI